MFDLLPPHVLQQIFLYLQPRDWLSLEKACRSLEWLLRQCLWRRVTDVEWLSSQKYKLGGHAYFSSIIDFTAEERRASSPPKQELPLDITTSDQDLQRALLLSLTETRNNTESEDTTESSSGRSASRDESLHYLLSRCNAQRLKIRLRDEKEELDGDGLTADQFRAALLCSQLQRIDVAGTLDKGRDTLDCVFLQNEATLTEVYFETTHAPPVPRLPNLQGLWLSSTSSPPDPTDLPKLTTLGALTHLSIINRGNNGVDLNYLLDVLYVAPKVKCLENLTLHLPVHGEITDGIAVQDAFTKLGTELPLRCIFLSFPYIVNRQRTEGLEEVDPDATLADSTSNLPRIASRALLLALAEPGFKKLRSLTLWYVSMRPIAVHSALSNLTNLTNASFAYNNGFDDDMLEEMTRSNPRLQSICVRGVELSAHAVASYVAGKPELDAVSLFYVRGLDYERMVYLMSQHIEDQGAAGGYRPVIDLQLTDKSLDPQTLMSRIQGLNIPGVAATKDRTHKYRIRVSLCSSRMHRMLMALP